MKSNFIHKSKFAAFIFLITLSFFTLPYAYSAGESSITTYQPDGAQLFTHPGLLNTQAELDLIREKVNAGEQPWLSGYQKIDEWFIDFEKRGYPKITSYTSRADRYRQYRPLVLGYVFRNSDGTTITRPPVTNFCWDSVAGKAQELMFDSRAAYASALYWVVTGDLIYANKAVEIINAWPSTVQRVSYNCSADGSYNNHTWLMISGSLPQMIYAAEIMRATYPSGWSATEQEKFSIFLRDKMYPNMTPSNRAGEECVQTGSNTNWGVMASGTRMAIAIFNDNNTQFNEAVLDYKFYIEKAFKPFGKNLETCRLGNGGMGCNSTAGGDLPHTQMTLQALTAMAEMGKKQGVDLYGYKDPADGHSLLTTLTYHAPFLGYNDDPTKSRIGASKEKWPCLTRLSGPCVSGQQCANADLKKYFWEMAYNHYRHPVLESIVVNWNRPEGNGAWSDVGWGTLTHAYSNVLYPPQDINSDGHVNISDIQLCIKVILGQADNPRADVNGDGVKNIKDVQAIIKAIINP